MNPTSSILECSQNKNNYNIITGICHERYEWLLSKTLHEFWGMTKPGVFKEKWNTNYGPIPNNYHVLDFRKGSKQIPCWINPEIFLIQNIFGQYQELMPLANIYHCPTIRLEHTASMNYWSSEQKKQLKNMVCNINVFITRWSLNSWEWEEDYNTFIIHHAIDTNLFKPIEIDRENYVLEVSNDYIGRDYVLDFSRFKRVIIDRNIPFKPLGDTKNFSKAPNSVEELVKEYNKARIFVNTHHVSPIPMSLLESAAMECAIVSCKTCGIPEFFTHGVNIMFYENDKEMAEYIDLLRNDKEFAKKLGENARKMILEKCSIDRFVSEWKQVFNLTRKFI